MDFEERRMWPLTSGTTCYSGARRVLCNDDDDDDDGIHVAKLATEFHSVTLTNLASEDNDKVMVSWRELLSRKDSDNNNDDPYLCVGYSHLNDWEAYVLLEQREEQTTTTTTTSLLETTNNRVGDTIITSTATTTTPDNSEHVATSSTTNSERRHHRRTTSGLSAADSSVVNINETTTSSSAHHHHHHHAPVESTDVSSVPVIADTAAASAQLVLRNNNVQSNVEYRASLDFRPLAPTLLLCQQQNSSSSIAIFLGSADHNKLQLYRIVIEQRDNNNDDDDDAKLRNNDDLVQVDLSDHAAFLSESPVMALDLVEISSCGKYCLAMACQDGTIRLVRFLYHHDNNNNNNQSMISVLQEHTVVVDGPLVCVHICKKEQQINDDDNNNNTTTQQMIHVVVGSLCGYVCELYCNIKNEKESGTTAAAAAAAATWEGPFMVAQGFWNGALQSEDSVLAVHACDEMVVVGTHAGRCLIYDKKERRSANNNYELQWECQLPYSIHAVTLLFDNNNNRRRLLVTTRRSVHLFVEVVGHRRHDAELAKRRLESMLNERGIQWLDDDSTKNYQRTSCS